MSLKTGPQIYPPASRRYWYQDDYPGSLMEVNVIGLHTTEGTTVPDYDGGKSAPTLTVLPLIQSQRVAWYQHYEMDVSSRALVNRYGGVETNTNNVAQVEMVGTCDPKRRHTWGTRRAGVDYIYWPDAPDWLLREIGLFIAWGHEYHGVPLVTARKWPAYPGSYGNGEGQRMTFSEWNAFRGVCGHMHVPENDHGDPGNINIGKIMQYAAADLSVPDTPTVPPTKPTQPPPNQPPAFPGRKFFGPGQVNDHVTKLGKRLVQRGFGKHYRSGPGPRWSEADRLNVRDFQKSRPELRGDADGGVGPLTWKLLFS